MDVTQQCEVGVFEGYAECESDAQVMYAPQQGPSALVPLCLAHAKELAQQYNDGDATAAAVPESDPGDG